MTALLCTSKIINFLNLLMRALRWVTAIITVIMILLAAYQFSISPIPLIYTYTPLIVSLGAVTISILNILIRKTD